ncbi:MAG: S8 family peptidase [Pseudomonadota bacterium]
MQERINTCLVCLLLFLAAIFVDTAGARSLTGSGPGQNGGTVRKQLPDEIIVKFKRGVSEGAIGSINRRHAASVFSVGTLSGCRRLRIPAGRTVQEMVKTYNNDPAVEYAEPNYIASAFVLPNDAYYRYQWNMKAINMESAWDIEPGGDPGIVVAVVDTGVAYENYGNYAQAPDLANTSFVPGYDFVNEDNHPNDDHGHGTHVTGTIAQSTNNGIGVTGVAFQTSIMPVKVLNSAGSGTYADIAEGICYAARNGANVINMSFGGSAPSITLENALAYAYNCGAVLVCAAGNQYDKGNAPSYPAAYDAYCIAVGATTCGGNRAKYSNTGQYLDLAAPGGDLSLDENKDGYVDGILQQTFGSDPKVFSYWFYQGTSMAAPHVAGVAALILSRNPDLLPDEVKTILQATAEDKGATGWDEEYGYGIVNAYLALAGTPAAELSSIHVADVTMQVKTKRVRLTRYTQALATVEITDAAGAPVQGVLVRGSWSGATFDKELGITDSTGSVTVSSNLLRNPRPGTTFTFIVENISNPDYRYDAESNLETSDSIRIE